MKKSNKKGFTIVELVIVIAIVAILAAVLIPTFSSIINKANQSSDIQAVRQMNMALAAESVENSPETVEDVINILAEAGYNSKDKLTPVSTGHGFYWHDETNLILLAKDVSSNELIYPKDNEKLKTAFDTDFAAKNGFHDLEPLAPAETEPGEGGGTGEGENTGGTQVSSLDELKNVINALVKDTPVEITLTENIKISEPIDVPKDTVLTLNLGDYSITLEGDYGSGTKLSIMGKMTINGGTIYSKYSDQNYPYNVANYISVQGGGELSLKSTNLTLQGAVGVANEGGTVSIDEGVFITVYESNSKYNTLLYNDSGTMTVTGTTFEEAKEADNASILYGFGAPIYNKAELEMKGVTISSSDFCTSTNGGTLTIDANSTLKLTGEKFLTPDGDYFAYNAYYGDEPTSNNCAEFTYYGTAEVNQLNLDVKNAFANGSTVTLTKDGQIGSAFIGTGKTIVIDLNGKTLTLNQNAYFKLSADDDLTIKNGTLIVDTGHEDASACIEVSTSSKLTIENVEFIDTAGKKGILNKGTLTITNSNFSVPADNIGASHHLLENNDKGVVTISGCTFGNTAPEATSTYRRITPIVNIDGEMILTNVEVNSITCCIDIVGTDSETIVTDCDLNYGAGFAEFSSNPGLNGVMEETVTCTENGVVKAFDILYA